MIREIIKHADGPSVAVAVANDFIKYVGNVLASKPAAHVSLTGGTVGILSLVKLAEHPDVLTLDWSRVHIWWGDERFVAANSKDRNALQAREALLNKLPLNPANVHEFPAFHESESESVSAQLDAAAESFASEVASVFAANGGAPMFDLTLLGMGPDGHIASLFPGHQLPAAGLSIIAEHNSPKPPPQRLSFTYEAINNSTEIWLVVAGADKAEAASVAFSDASTRLPVGRVHALGKTVWHLDQAAGEGI